MSSTDQLKSLVEARGGKPIVCEAAELQSRLGFDIQEMKRKDVSVLEEHQKFNDDLDRFISHPQMGLYLCKLTPLETYIASGMRILPLEQIKREISQGSAPGGCIRNFGYLVFATSAGGNTLCFHAPSGQVVWADHDSFTDDSISYQDRQTGDWNYLDFSEKNVGKAVVPLSTDFENFLSALLDNKLAEQLDKLD